MITQRSLFILSKRLAISTDAMHIGQEIVCGVRLYRKPALDIHTVHPLHRS